MLLVSGGETGHPWFWEAFTVARYETPYYASLKEISLGSVSDSWQSMSFSWIRIFSFSHACAHRHAICVLQNQLMGQRICGFIWWCMRVCVCVCVRVCVYACVHAWMRACSRMGVLCITPGFDCSLHAPTKHCVLPENVCQCSHSLRFISIKNHATVVLWFINPES